MTGEIPGDGENRMCRLTMLMQVANHYAAGGELPESGAAFNDFVQRGIDTVEPSPLEPCQSPKLPQVGIAHFGRTVCSTMCILGEAKQTNIAETIDRAHAEGISYAQAADPTRGIQY